MAGGSVGGGDEGHGPQRGGKRRSAARYITEEEPEFQVAPMIDVLLVLMIFFVSITTADILQNKKELTLAQADAGKPKDKKESGESVINLEGTAAGHGVQIFLGDQRVATPDALANILKPLAAAAPKDDKGRSRFTVRLRADKAVKYEFIRQIMIACGAAGVDHIIYSVAPRTGKQAEGG